MKLSVTGERLLTHEQRHLVHSWFKRHCIPISNVIEVSDEQPEYVTVVVLKRTAAGHPYLVNDETGESLDGTPQSYDNGKPKIKSKLAQDVLYIGTQDDPFPVWDSDTPLARHPTHLEQGDSNAEDHRQ